MHTFVENWVPTTLLSVCVTFFLSVHQSGTCNTPNYRPQTMPLSLCHLVSVCLSGTCNTPKYRPQTMHLSLAILFPSVHAIRQTIDLKQYLSVCVILLPSVYPAHAIRQTIDLKQCLSVCVILFQSVYPAHAIAKYRPQTMHLSLAILFPSVHAIHQTIDLKQYLSVCHFVSVYPVHAIRQTIDLKQCI